MSENIKMSPQEFDNQSPVKIDRWIDIDSKEAIEKDENRPLTKKMIMIGFEDGWMTFDSLGRIFGKDPKRNIYFPFHFECGKELVGFRMAKKATN